MTRERKYNDLRNNRIGETGIGEIGIGETGIGETGIGETGTTQNNMKNIKNYNNCFGATQTIGKSRKIYFINDILPHLNTLNPYSNC